MSEPDEQLEDEELLDEDAPGAYAYCTLTEVDVFTAPECS
jgi:hypothetical protein